MRNKDKMREYQRQWMAARRAEAIAGRGGKCVQCGSTDQLEIDHIDRATKTDHRIWSWAVKKREAELAKCQLLCKACHLIKTSDEVARKPNDEGSYQCSKCRQFYPPSGFHKDTHKSGFSSWCKQCRNARARLRDRRKNKNIPNARILALT